VTTIGIFIISHRPSLLFIETQLHIYTHHPSIYSSIYPSIHLSIHLFIHPYIYSSIHLSIHSSIYLSIHSSIYLSIYLSIYSSCVSTAHLFSPYCRPDCSDPDRDAPTRSERVRLSVIGTAAPSHCDQQLQRCTSADWLRGVDTAARLQ